MSHFCVAVLSKNGEDDIEELLAPFDENIEVSRYVRYTKEQLIAIRRKSISNIQNGAYAEYLKDPEKYERECNNPNHVNFIKNKFPEMLTWTDEQCYQSEIQGYGPDEIAPDGGIYSTYNPDSKWDWYVIGGRWSNMLKLKTIDGLPPVSTNSAKLKDIDFTPDEMEYAKFIRWWELRIEDAEPKSASEEELLKRPMYPVREWYIQHYGTKEDYAKRQCRFLTYAIITPDGKWHEKGQMGWFGCSSETDEEAREWDLNFYDRFLKDADPELYLTIVDCHI